LPAIILFSYIGDIMKTLWVVLLAALFSIGASMAQSGVKKKRPPPREYGRVIMNNYSEKAQLAPVVFDHWLHRATYSCRLCHVDIGFAMTANGTGIKAADNIKGEYCGVCHNGKMSHAGERIFGACASQSKAADAKACNRCHSLGKDVSLRNDFAAVTGNFPRERFGNGIGWMETEAEGRIKIIDSLEGISAKTAPMKNPRDLTIEPKAVGMPDIVFSHDKHAVWNGCELCLPDLFPSVQKAGGPKYSMNEIFENKYCGACHGKVAFPLIECRRCHAKPVVEK